MKQKVLFVCIHNSARSQMGEAWLNHLCGGHFEAQSAGLEPGTLNPLVVEAMAEVGIDIAEASTNSVAEMLSSNTQFSHVITVCDETSAERCPVFPGDTQRVHWSFPDPSQFTGTLEEKLAKVREVRGMIRDRVQQWCSEQTGADCAASA